MEEQEQIQKKLWQKPELRILCRGENEENVLASCKNHGSFFDGGPGGLQCGDPWSWMCKDNTGS